MYDSISVNRCVDNALVIPSILDFFSFPVEYISILGLPAYVSCTVINFSPNNPPGGWLIVDLVYFDSAFLDNIKSRFKQAFIVLVSAY